MEQVYIKMEETDRSLVEKVSKLLLTGYNIKGDFIPLEDLWDMIDELTRYLEEYQEENEKLKRELEY